MPRKTRKSTSPRTPRELKPLSTGRITRAAMLKAIAEFDEIGEAAFLNKYGFGAATKLSIVIGTREYPPKAIVGAAAQHCSIGRPLKPNEFSSGIRPLGAVFRRCEFTLDFKLEGDAS